MAKKDTTTPKKTTPNKKATSSAKKKPKVINQDNDVNIMNDEATRKHRKEIALLSPKEKKKWHKRTLDGTGEKRKITYDVENDKFVMKFGGKSVFIVERGMPDFKDMSKDEVAEHLMKYREDLWYTKEMTMEYLEGLEEGEWNNTFFHIELEKQGVNITIDKNATGNHKPTGARTNKSRVPTGSSEPTRG